MINDSIILRQTQWFIMQLYVQRLRFTVKCKMGTASSCSTAAEKHKMLTCKFSCCLSFSLCVHPRHFPWLCRIFQELFKQPKANSAARFFAVHRGSLFGSKCSWVEQGRSGQAHFLAAVALARLRRSIRRWSVVDEQRDRTVLISDSLRLSIAASAAPSTSLSDREYYTVALCLNHEQ